MKTASAMTGKALIVTSTSKSAVGVSVLAAFLVSSSRKVLLLIYE